MWWAPLALDAARSVLSKVGVLTKEKIAKRPVASVIVLVLALELLFCFVRTSNGEEFASCVEKTFDANPIVHAEELTDG